MTDCVLHKGCTMKNGYGQVRRKGKTWLAHRWAAHVAHGPCPVGQVVRHSCDNRLCINPSHLQYGTQGDNLIDRRERHRYRKLTRQDAEAIRSQLEVKTLQQLADEYKVSVTMIYNIKHRRQWR